MKACHIVPHIDEEASGPSYSVPRLCNALAGHGAEIVLASLDRGAGAKDLTPVEHRVFRQSRFPRRLGRSPDLRRWLVHAAMSEFDLLHAHGLWMLPNIYPALAARKARIPLIVAPRGTLDPAALAFSSGLKRAVWLAGQGAAVRSAAALHATSEEEVAHIRDYGLRQPIILSPNGIDLPAQRTTATQSRRTLLYLGRLHHKKGIDMLLDAWAELEARFPEWDLRIVGKGEPDYVASLAARIERLGLTNARLEGPVFGEEKTGAYADADLFVLPTRGENFGMVVAEALAAGTPVVTTSGAPWAGLESRKAGWWCAPSTPAIGNALAEGMSMPAEGLREAGRRGRQWMGADYAWESIGEQLLVAYRWLLGEGSRPDNVILD